MKIGCGKVGATRHLSIIMKTQSDFTMNLPTLISIMKTNNNNYLYE